MAGPAEVTAQRWRRSRPLHVLLDIADRTLRADAIEACEDAGMVVVDASGRDPADVILIERPVATAMPAIVLAPEGARWFSQRSWPATVCAVVPADTDADTLAAVITCAAAGYAVTARWIHIGPGDAADDPQHVGGDDRDNEGGDEDGDWLAAGAAGSTLSSREREVLSLLAAGASNKEIALALDVSVSTVKFHVAAIIQKLGARSRVDAVAFAVRAGMVMI